LPGRHAFPNELVRNECEGDAGKKKEQRRGKGSTQLRKHEERGFARAGGEPGVVAMGLEHEDAGETAHPVDVGEARCARSGHSALCADT
jgi:hypothetical protein